jgi:xanthine dehydrogenase accessory factor
MDIEREILAGLQRGEGLALATIVSSSGSTPVPPGAKMLVRDRPDVPLGTIGGGCIEADVLGEARAFLRSSGTSMIRRFTLTEDNIESGMLCGGMIDVLVERLPEEESAVYTALCSCREAGRDAALVTVLGPAGEKRTKLLLPIHSSGMGEEEIRLLERVAGDLPGSSAETFSGAVERQTVVRLPVSGGELVIEPVIGLQDLIIFGGGHVSKVVLRAAALAGFRVTVVDDRPEYANAVRFPEAWRTLAVGFDDAWSQLPVSPSTSIVIVTRGHKFDERVLEHAVRTPARYIGMIGSQRKVTATFANLLGRGVSRELLKHVRSPIGLEIGAATAEEIGISIVAELIAVRRGAHSSGAPMSDRVAGFFQGWPPD